MSMTYFREAQLRGSRAMSLFEIHIEKICVSYIIHNSLVI